MLVNKNIINIIVSAIMDEGHNSFYQTNELLQGKVLPQEREHKLQMGETKQNFTNSTTI